MISDIASLLSILGNFLVYVSLGIPPLRFVQ